MDYETIMVTKEEGVATITLNRPDQMNAGNEKMFAEICRASDEYVLNNHDGDKYQVFRFIELINDTKGGKHVWCTMKGIVPREVGKGKYFWGRADFLDALMGYDNAIEFVKNEQKLKKLSDNLYIYG